jgi:hypothetical protein
MLVPHQLLKRHVEERRHLLEERVPNKGVLRAFQHEPEITSCGPNSACATIIGGTRVNDTVMWQ